MAHSPDPARERDADLLRAASARGLTYLENVDLRSVAPRPEAVAALAAFDVALSDHGRPAHEVLALLDDVGSPATVASASGRYFGFVIGGALPVAVASAWLGAAWDQNGALEVMSPVGSTLDRVAMRWVVDLLGLAPDTVGAFVSGASMANTTCLATARDAVLRARGWDAPAEGLVGAPPVQVVLGEEAHATVLKALGLVGLGRERAVRLATDDQGRIIPRDLPVLEPGAIVCLQAGNVNSGASDPFDELIDWAHASGAWVHVDGAFGLWAKASPRRAEQVRGVERADSWATDAHKWLNVTYDSGIALVREGSALEASMSAQAAYLPPGEAHDPWRYTPQASQRVRAIEVWAVLATLGRSGVSDLIERTCAHAETFAQRLAGAGVDVLNDVVLNQVVVDFGGAQRNARLLAALRDDGTCWCGPTVWRGRSGVRISVSSWATTDQDVELSADAMIRLAEQTRG